LVELFLLSILHNWNNMRVEEFYQNRNQDWDMLNRLVKQSQTNISQLSPKEIQTLAALYRTVTSDLAVAQRDFPRHQVTNYLNQLVGHAHAVIYREEPLAINRFTTFITKGFPRLYREMFPFILVAMLMFAIPAVASGISTAIAPETATQLLPASIQDLIPVIEKKSLWTDIPIMERPYTSSFIMQNNIRVSFLAFSSGITGGLLTLLVLASNGLILGGLTGLTYHYGIGFELSTFVIGHGVIELSVIFMAGGAGLMVGWALLRPGLLRRRDALAEAARKSVRLLAGAVPLLVLAGTIEGFISPAKNIAWPIKWAVGIGSGILLYTYLTLAGRERKPRRRLQ
jgi:uncharacterized membrane protein SpoIIM required for sporulation